MPVYMPARLQIGLVTLGHIAVGNVTNKCWIWVKHHDVKVFNSVNGLETGPILEPYHLQRPESQSVTLSMLCYACERTPKSKGGNDGQSEGHKVKHK